MKNILMLSAGTRNLIIQYLRKELNGEGKIIAADCDHLAPALYEADEYFLIPRITDSNYFSTVLRICKDENISGIFSMIDSELSVLAQHEKEFAENGVMVLGSPKDVCELTINKYEFYLWMRDHGYNCARSYSNLTAFLEDRANALIDFPVFVKPYNGSASAEVSVVEDEEMLRLLCLRHPHLMIQEYLKGQEIGADCYVDIISKKTVSIFTKKKILMRAGETDKSVSFKDPKLFTLISQFNKDLGVVAQLDIDLFDCGGTYYFSEVNPRFGGGYPHAYECGANHIRMMLNNLEGIENPCVIGQYEENKYMMKYGEVKII